MTFEDPVQGRQDRTERGVVELRLGEDRRVPGGEDELVTFPQRESERLGEPESRWRGLAGTGLAQRS